MAEQGGGVRWTRRQIQDRAALAAMAAGVIGLVVTAFAWDPLAGAAVVSVLLFGLGVALGID